MDVKTKTGFLSVARRFGLIVIIMGAAVACSPSAARSGVAMARHDTRTLSPKDAAELAARLANDECYRVHQKRPFKAEQYSAVLEGKSYRWGRLDPGAPAGLSAVVTFQSDGSEPNVRIYFSTDKQATR